MQNDKNKLSINLNPLLSRYVDNVRKERGMSIIEISGVLGIHRNSYNRILKGPDGFTEVQLRRAAAEFGFDIEAKIKL